MVAAACVMPLSASGILNRSPERQMGLRHRAALGITEVSDAVSVVVSEQSGSISIAHAGRMIRRIDPERLENILIAFFRPEPPRRSGLAASGIFPIFSARMNNMRLFATNIRTFLLALVLGVSVWVSAVIAADPNEVRTYPQLHPNRDRRTGSVTGD